MVQPTAARPTKSRNLVDEPSTTFSLRNASSLTASKPLSTVQNLDHSKVRRMLDRSPTSDPAPQWDFEENYNVSYFKFRKVSLPTRG